MLQRLAVGPVLALVMACAGSRTPSVPVAGAAPASPAPAAAEAPVRRYQVLFNGREVGHATLAVAADGSRRSHYEFNDRGRGPALDVQLVLSARGLPRSMTIDGVNYAKVAVDETLVADGGMVRWTAATDRGEAAVDSGFYLPAQSLFDDEAVLARALRQAPGRRLPLLPGGEAWIEDDTVHEVNIAGTRRRLSRVSIAGLGFQPDTVWLDEDGELFGWVGRWFSLVPDGATAAVPTLIALDEAADDRRAAVLATRLTHVPPAAGLAIVNARVFDPVRKRLVAGQTVRIVGDRIVAIGARGAVKLPPGTEVIDAGGKTLVPGLWDMHVHLWGGLMHIARGVTSVRDLGNDLDGLDAAVDRFDRGVEIGPRVVKAGLVDGPGPFAGPTKLLVSTADEARATVDLLASRGYRGVKLYSSLPPALVPVFVDAAHRRGMRVSGHIPFGMSARQAVEAGFDELQHINFVFLNFLAGPGDDTRTPVRFKLVGSKATTLDLSSPEVASFIDLLRTKKTVVDPTLGAFEELFAARKGELQPGLAAVAARLPARVQRELRDGGAAATADDDKAYPASFRALMAMVKLLWDRGVTLVAGTDSSYPGFALHRELELYVAAGIPAADVIAMATLGAARVAGADRELGSIAVGKRADLYLVDGDPLTDISALRRGVLVISRGRRFVPAEIDAELGVAPAPSAAP
jgi:hypothetical protein